MPNSCARCSKDAKMQCPTCVKLHLSPTYYCSQECFKVSWKDHKTSHVKQTDAMLKTLEKVGGRVEFIGYNFSGPMRPAALSPMRVVPEHIGRPDYADDPDGIPHMEMSLRGSNKIPVYTKEQIAGIREACRLGREVLDIAGKACKVGVTTDEIDRIVHEACIERDCYPSPLNYKNFPKSCCTSLNEIICHGIPDKRALKDGDICNVDISVFHKGYHGDLNETFLIGEVSAKDKKLVQTTYECLENAIAACKPGFLYRDIGRYITEHARKNGCSVVRSYCGHGIGELFHCSPNVPHYANNKAIGTLKVGNVFTIEPMINQGKYGDQLWPDDWTSATKDGKKSAQFEHTLLVTETGVEVLTKRTSGSYIDRF